MRACLAAAAVAVAAAAAPAGAQDWPARPVKIVVPLAPGAAADLIARPVGEELSAAIRQPVIIENKPGAGGSIAADFVTRSAPDGYTLLLGTSGTNGTATYLFKKLPYDPLKDFTPLTNAVEIPIALVVHHGVPANTVAEFIAYAKSNPGKLSFGSSGYGTSLHLAGELLKSRTGIDIVHVPYRGGNPAMTDLLAGQIPAAFATLSTALPYAQNGQIRILGTVGARRSRPDIPTIGETVPDCVMPPTWVGFLAPAGLPDALAARLNAELVRAINAAPVRKLLEDSGFEIGSGTTAEFAEMMRVSVQRFGKIVSDAGIKPQ